MIISVVVTFFIVGCFAGVLAGLLGTGGGVIFVPLQVIVFQFIGIPADLQMKLAVGTSLATMFLTTLTAGSMQARRKAVLWKMLGKMTVGIVIGAFIGAYLARIMPSKLLEIFFGVGAIGLGIFFFTLNVYHEHSPMKPPKLLTTNLLGLVVGTFSSMIGIGGGTLTVPILVKLREPIRKAIGTATCVSCVLSFSGSLIWLFPAINGGSVYKDCLGYIYFPSFIPMAVGAILSAGFGVKMAHGVSRKILKRIFAVVLCVVGLVIIFR